MREGEQTFRTIMENKRFIKMKFHSLMTVRLKLSRYFTFSIYCYTFGKLRGLVCGSFQSKIRRRK